MARIRMVTRTVTETVALAMCVDVAKAHIYDTEIKVSGEFSDDSELLKAVKAVAETVNNKVVAIKAHSIKETLYGMPEEKFIAFADILPPRKLGDNETDNA